MKMAPPSDRRHRANRENARLSSGPKSAAGKARSSRNALRHGLNVLIWDHPILASEAESLAERIAGPNATPAKRELARRIGAAQVDLMRIRAVRQQKIVDMLSNRHYEQSLIPRNEHSKKIMELLDKYVYRNPLVVDPEDLDLEIEMAMNKEYNEYLGRVAPRRSPPDKLALILEKNALELQRLDRYERRALSRRRIAIRQFEALAGIK